MMDKNRNCLLIAVLMMTLAALVVLVVTTNVVFAAGTHTHAPVTAPADGKLGELYTPDHSTDNRHITEVIVYVHGFGGDFDDWTYDQCGCFADPTGDPQTYAIYGYEYYSGALTFGQNWGYLMPDLDDEADDLNDAILERIQDLKTHENLTLESFDLKLYGHSYGALLIKAAIIRASETSHDMDAYYNYSAYTSVVFAAPMIGGQSAAATRSSWWTGWGIFHPNVATNMDPNGDMQEWLYDDADTMYQECHIFCSTADERAPNGGLVGDGYDSLIWLQEGYLDETCESLHIIDSGDDHTEICDNNEVWRQVFNHHSCSTTRSEPESLLTTLSEDDKALFFLEPYGFFFSKTEGGADGVSDPMPGTAFWMDWKINSRLFGSKDITISNLRSDDLVVSDVVKTLTLGENNIWLNASFTETGISKGMADVSFRIETSPSHYKDYNYMISTQNISKEREIVFGCPVLESEDFYEDPNSFDGHMPDLITFYGESYYFAGEQMLSTSALADFDHDGTLETVTIIGGDKLVVMNANGTVRWSTPLYSHYLTGIYPVVADVDQDGELDIVVSNYEENTIRIFSMTRNNWYTINGASYGVYFGMPTVANVDSDPWLEIVSARNLTISVIHETSVITKAFTDKTFTPIAAGPTVVDLEGDGSVEIITGDICVLDKDLNKIWSISRDTSGSQGVAVSDLDGDNKLDIITGDRAFASNGSPMWHSEGLGVAHVAPIVADLDNDKNEEVLVILPNGYLYVLNSAGEKLWSRSCFGHSSFQSNAESIEKAQIYPGLQAYPPVLFDLNGDGQLEIIVNTAYSTKIFDCNGTQIICPGAYTGDPLDFRMGDMPLVADIDNDGEIEIVTRSIDSSTSDSLLVQSYSFGSCSPGTIFCAQYQLNPQRTGCYNRPPEFYPISEIIANVGEHTVFTLSAHDPEGDALTYRADFLPSGAAFDPSTKEFTWAPYVSSEGNAYDAIFVVSDGIREDRMTVSIHVNAPPVISLFKGEDEIFTGETVIANAGEYLNLKVLVDDPEGDAITFLVGGGETLGAYIDSTTGNFYCMPSDSETGCDYSVGLSAFDGARYSETITITIHVNAPPVVSVYDMSIPWTQTFILPMNAYVDDPDGEETETFTFEFNCPPPIDGEPGPHGTLLEGATFDSETATFQWPAIPDVAYPDDLPCVAFTVTDKDGASADGYFYIRVTNEAPYFTGAPREDIIVTEGGSADFALYASDPDDLMGNYLAISIDPYCSLPTGASFIDNGNGHGSFIWTPSKTDEGSRHYLSFIVSDGYLEERISVNIYVEEANKPPEIDTIDDLSIEFGETLDLTIRASDPNDDPLRFSTIGLPVGSDFQDNGDGTAIFTWTPSDPSTDSGDFFLQFYVTDGTETASRWAYLKVAPPPKTSAATAVTRKRIWNDCRRLRKARRSREISREDFRKYATILKRNLKELRKVQRRRRGGRR